MKVFRSIAMLPCPAHIYRYFTVTMRAPIWNLFYFYFFAVSNSMMMCYFGTYEICSHCCVVYVYLDLVGFMLIDLPHGIRLLGIQKDECDQHSKRVPFLFFEEFFRSIGRYSTYVLLSKHWRRYIWPDLDYIAWMELFEILCMAEKIDWLLFDRCAYYQTLV